MSENDTIAGQLSRDELDDEELEHIKKRRALKEASRIVDKVRKAIIEQCMEEHQWENKEGQTVTVLKLNGKNFCKFMNSGADPEEQIFDPLGKFNDNVCVRVSIE